MKHLSYLLLATVFAATGAQAAAASSNATGSVNAGSQGMNIGAILKADMGPSGKRLLAAVRQGRGLWDVRSNNTATISDKSSTNSTSSAFRFQVSTNGIPSMRTFYYASANDTAERFSYRVGLLALAEFNATAPVSLSSNVFRLGGRGQAWSDITQTSTTSGNATIQQFTSTLTDPNSSLTVKWDVFVTSQLTTANSTTFKPNSVKHSLTIQNFSYKLVNSSLAIIEGIFSAMAGQRSVGTDGRVLLGTVGRVDWADTVTLDAAGTTSAAIVAETAFRSSADDAMIQQNGDDISRAAESVSLMVYKVNATAPSYVHWDPDMSLSSDTTAYSNSTTTTVGSSAVRSLTSSTWNAGVTLGAAALAYFLRV